MALANIRSLLRRHGDAAGNSIACGFCLLAVVPG